VSGSQRRPLPVRNHPLKSTHHTWLGPCPFSNGPMLGCARTRRLTARVNPCRRKMLLTLLSAGQSSHSNSLERILGAPHAGRRLFHSRICCSICSEISLG